jgi:hypothetical protein
VQGIDMTLFTKRLQRDWYQRYLLDPQAVRPGTRMPAFWPDGQTFYPKLLDGKTATQIEATWEYLKAGTSAQPPVGLGKSPIVLTPTSGAIIYRNFIAGAGPRAIGVGYPEKVNLAFDANDLRLALVWQGAFIDAARHWTDRGVGFEGPLGDNVLVFAPGPNFAALPTPDAAWPAKPNKEAGDRFLGYKLTPDDRPTFRYSVGGLTIEDFASPTAGAEPGLRRTLTLSGSADHVYFRAAVGTKIAALGGGAFQIDGWKLKVTGGGEPTVRQSGGKAELLVPVKLADGKGEFVTEMVW